MRGLLYKEFYQFRIDFWIITGLEILLCGLSITSVVTFDPSEPQWTIIMLLASIYTLSIMLGSILCSEFFSKDEKRPWNHFAMALPQTEAGQVLAKYYAVLLVHLYVLFVCFIADTIAVVVVGDSSISAMTVAVVVFCIRMLVMVFEIPFVLRFGAQTGTTVEGTVAGILFVAIGIYLLFGDISFLLQENFWEALMEWIQSGNVVWVLAILPYITGVFYYLSYRVSLKLYRKGVENSEQ